MVKNIFPFFLPLLFLGFLISGCSPTFCSTPYILSGGDCCLDKNEDAICDARQELPSDEQEEYVQTASQEQERERPATQQQPLTTEEGILLTVDPDDDPVQGNAYAEVFILEFGDYADERSQRFHKEVLPKILQAYGTKIKYVFRNFPETNNEQAQLSAEASECADEQKKFWDYHERLFAQSHRLTLSSLRQMAMETGLDMDAFEACLFSHRYKSEVLADKEDGLVAGVSSTPTFFINNKKVIGFKPFEKFDEVFRDIFYEELQAERGTTITATPVGLAYAILPGPAALEPSVTGSPYSNHLELVDAVFSVSATDITPRDSGTSQDTAALSVTYSSKHPLLTGKDIYTITLQHLLTEGVSHSFFGGVGTQVDLHGNTGVGTRYLPRSTVYLTLWGAADVKKNGKPFIEDALVHFMITPGIRNEKHILLSAQEDTDIEAYLLVSARDKTSLPFDGGFLHLFWPEVHLGQE